MECIFHKVHRASARKDLLATESLPSTLKFKRPHFLLLLFFSIIILNVFLLLLLLFFRILNIFFLPLFLFFGVIILNIFLFLLLLFSLLYGILIGWALT